MKLPSNRSQRTSHHGARAEEAVRERYGLQSDHASWYDATFKNGSKVEIKSAIYRRANGDEGRFRIFEDCHQRLTRANGWYAWVTYRERGRGVEILRMRMMKARTLRWTTWHKTGGHRDQREGQIPISRIF